MDLNHFKSGAFIGRFPSDGMVISTAVKGLMLEQDRTQNAALHGPETLPI